MPQRHRHLRFFPFALGATLVALSALGATGQEATGAAASETAGSTAAAAPEKPRVVLYQTEWCPYCRKAQKLLDELGVAYAAKDIEKDPVAHREFLAKGKGGTGIPLLDIGGRMIRGYQEDKIRKAVAELERAQANPSK
jgi:glutaredoxin